MQILGDILEVISCCLIYTHTRFFGLPFLLTKIKVIFKNICDKKIIALNFQIVRKKTKQQKTHKKTKILIK